MAPRPAPRGGHGAGGGSAQSARASGPDEPVILGERASAQPLPQRHARRGPRGPREGQAGEPTSREPPFKFRQARAPRCSCGCGSAVGGSARTARRSAGQEAEHRQRPMRTDGLPHACGVRLSGCGPASAVCCTPVVGRMRRTLLGWWQVGAEAACDGCCLGGGRLGQRQHNSLGMLFE